MKEEEKKYNKEMEEGMAWTKVWLRRQRMVYKPREQMNYVKREEMMNKKKEEKEWHYQYLQLYHDKSENNTNLHIHPIDLGAGTAYELGDVMHNTDEITTSSMMRLWSPEWCSTTSFLQRKTTQGRPTLC